MARVVEDVPPGSVPGAKYITTRWEREWRWTPDQCWQREVRCVCRVYKWQEWREDLYFPGPMRATNRLIDYHALEIKRQKFKFDCTDAYYQATETKLITVDAPEYKAELVEQGQHPDTVWSDASAGWIIYLPSCVG